MIKVKQIALDWLPSLMAAGLLVQATDALAAAPSGDAQTQAREILLGNRAAARGPLVSEKMVLDLRIPARAADAGQAARGLILGTPSTEELPLGAQTLQARATPFAASRASHAGRQDAQAQARRLIHGGAA